MRSLVFIGASSALVAVTVSSFAQTPAQGPSTAAFPSDTPTASPPASAPPPSAPPPAAAPAPPAAAPAPPSPVAPAPTPGAPSAAPTPAPPPPGPEGSFVPSLAVPPPAPGQDVFSTVPPVEPVWPPHLVQSPGWFGGLEGYGGILTLGGSDTREAYAFLGGQLRLRYDYYELGGYFEASDHPDNSDQFSAFGGFIGAWLPYRGWVDFEIAASVGARNYRSDDVRYGPGGYDDSSPTLGLRLGVSDRTSSFSALAGRIGGQLVFAYDLNPADEPWAETLERDGEAVTETGTTRVGGFTLALALVIGLDYGKAIKPSPVASETPR